MNLEWGIFLQHNIEHCLQLLKSISTYIEKALFVRYCAISCAATTDINRDVHVDMSKMVLETLLGTDIHTILLGAAALLIIPWWLQKPKNLPPGPWGWPMVGYLPNLVIALNRMGNRDMFTDIARKYGAVCSMQIGGRLVVVLNTHRVIKEAFRNPNLSERPHTVNIR